MAQFEWSDLRFFLELVRAGNPTRASQRLRVDHSTVRRRVAALEDGLQARLFSNRGPTYDLTHEGEQLLHYVEAIETMVIRAEEEVANRDLALSGAVRIGAPDGFGVRFLAPRLADFSGQHPDLQLQLVVMSRVVNLSNREADIAIGYAPPNQNRQIVRKLTDYTVGLYGSRAYLDVAQPLNCAADLRQHRLIGYIRDLLQDDTHDLIETIASDATVAFESTSIFTQIEAAAAGLGLCFVPCFLADADDRLVRVLPNEIASTRQFWLIVHPEMINLARVRAAIDFIAEAVRRDVRSFLPDEVDG